MIGMREYEFLPLGGEALYIYPSRKHHNPKIKPTSIGSQDYSSKAVETRSARLILIGGGGRVAALALWALAPGQLLGGLHFVRLPSRVFWSILELLMWSFLYVNPTCGHPFVLVLITPRRIRQSPKLMEFYRHRKS